MIFGKRRTAAKRKKGPDPNRRLFSFAFLLAIPGNFILAGVLLLSFLSLIQRIAPDAQQWTVFGMGLVSGFILVGTSKIPRGRVFIHELRHAVVVLLTGNRLKNFHVDRHTGHVTFEMAKDRVHFAPIITLAPYFFPLFSIPALGACLLFGQSYPMLLTLILGFTLAADLQTCFAELHPHQSDLRRVTGGFVGSALYLSGAHIAWISIVLIWVSAGINGYAYSGYLFWNLVERFAARYEDYLSYT